MVGGRKVRVEVDWEGEEDRVELGGRGGAVV